MKQEQIRLIEQMVIRFRQDTGLSNTESINLKSLLLKLKVMTVFRPLSDDFCGMSLKDKSSRRFMLINSRHTKGRQHFSIVHELYHLYMEENPKPHKCSLGNKDKDSSEQCADMFASIFLIPEDGILQLLPENEMGQDRVSMASVLRLEHYYSVSRQAILNRLKDLSFITKKGKDSLLSIPVKQSAREYGYDTSLYIPGNENLIIGDFGEKAKLLFDAGKISEGHYLEMLDKLNYGEEE